MNNWLFKYNGLTAWTRASRVMALNAGHKFLLTHASDTNEHSARYRQELGLRAGDIQATPDGKEVQLTSDDAARDERVRAALMQFVDESILRPNALQTPMWVSDPFMGLVAQYKGFAYAMYDQIYKRAFDIELGNRNFKVLGAVAAYIPMIIAAELMREAIQYLGDGDPRRKEWGPVEYTQLAVSRSGIFTPQMNLATDLYQDVQRQALPGTSQAGPTLSQAGNTVRAFEGRADLGKAVETALPLSAAFRKWNDSSADAAGAATTTTMGESK